jgi:hypothetical protein
MMEGVERRKEKGMKGEREKETVEEEREREDKKFQEWGM